MDRVVLLNLALVLIRGTELPDATQALEPASDCNYTAPVLPTLWWRIRQLGALGDQGFMVAEKLAC
jgi:hypothetical protein